MKKFHKMALATVATVILVFSAAYTPNYFEISKQLDIFTNVFKEVNLYYVDETEPGELMTEAMESMLNSLDPYTSYIPEERVEDFKIQTTGNYGGIGATIRKHQDHLLIAQPYQGFAADKAGLRAGDRILSVDGQSISGKNTSEVSTILKGAPGTEVNLEIERAGETFTKTIEREEVQLKSVPYYGMLNDSIAYISLNSFTQKASREILDAMKELKEENEVKGLVLDLRGNPGGLLSEAVNVSNIFIPKGKEVVMTKGKLEEWEKSYKTLNKPADLETPIAVLINAGSASASEIVAGTIQDYDRGVVIGQRSFGKGLVQQTRKLPYGAQLKVTIAKYYTPSGRCIQAINYAERDEDGSVTKIPDSLRTEFSTEAGRPVFDGGGIDPDIVVEQKEISESLIKLYEDLLIFNFATRYAREHEQIAEPREFRLNDEEYKAFLEYLEENDFSYETDTEKMMAKLKKTAAREGSLEEIESQLESLQDQYLNTAKKDMKLYRNDIKRLLEEEIASRYYYSSGRIANSLSSDEEVLKAIEILNNRQTYQSILDPQS